MFIAGVCCTALAFAALGHHAKLPQTRWDPLSDPLLGDLLEYPGTYRFIHTTAFFDNAVLSRFPKSMFPAVAYPPFATALMAPLYTCMNPIWGFLCSATVCLIAAWFVASRYLARNGFSLTLSAWLACSLLCCSFPIARLVHQGNLELLLWAFVAAGTWAFLKKHNLTCAVLWGLASAAKLYPALLLLLLLPRRRPGALLTGVSAGVGVSWLSLWWIGPTVAIAWRGSVRNILGYQNLRAGEWSLRELAANHSWFSWAKLMALCLHIASHRLLGLYYLGGAILIVWTLWRVWGMSTANQLLAMNVLMVALPSISYYHTLVHLYAPLLLLLGLAGSTWRTSRTTPRGLTATLLFFVPLFAPYNLLLLPHALLFCGLIQGLLLLALFLCAVEVPFVIPA